MMIALLAVSANLTPLAALSRPTLVQYPPPEIVVPYTEAQLQARIRRNRDDLEAHFYLMCLYAQQKSWRKSLHHALQSIRLEPLEGNAQLGVIYAYANLGDWQNAYRTVESALKHPFDAFMRSSLLRVKGNLLMDKYERTRQKQFLEQALATYQQAIRLDSENTLAIVGAARVRIEQGKYDIAERLLQQARRQVREQEPGGRRKKALILYYLGVIEEKRGRSSAANQLYKEALRAHPASFIRRT
jgi:tetratricopeptide (TPR) repeat protein